ncbi:bifunctional lysozyme/C40 family peptidase [Nocardiopsis sp. CNR-923]|uniref:C40 family peptidase n=1 Tax=Nocardiopsis sp. CNR-923 TaxID=1904965 RepID=UPI0021CCD549|nr:C40 family peptidase [Nocardiopsis sp. CNR-923]
MRGFLLPPRGRDGDRGAAPAAARVGGGVTGLAVMAGIAFVSTMCGPGGATASDFGTAGSGNPSSGVIQASASSSGESITINSHGENGSREYDKSIRVDIPEDILRFHRAAADAYKLPWELLAAVGAVETQNGSYPGVRDRGTRNSAGAAGILQFGVADLNGGNVLAAGNAWGGKPDQRVSQRAEHYDVGEIPTRGVQYFGIDGNNDGRVNVWDSQDNIVSGAFRLAYYAQLAKNGSKDPMVARCRPLDLDPTECTLYVHNNAPWYVAQVLDVMEYYSNSGIAPTSPSLSIQAASFGSEGEDCSEGGGVNQAAYLGNAGPAHRGAIEFARSKIGLPYVWGGVGPNGYDCSGLVMAAWNSVGVQIPRTTFAQWQGGQPPSTWDGADVAVVLDGTLDIDALQPGDLLYFHYSGQSPSHMGMYVGGGRMIHAPRTGQNITEVSIDTDQYRRVFIGAIRISPDSSDSGGGNDTFDA